jgi:predicted RecA/RadA family phage recombinase
MAKNYIQEGEFITLPGPSGGVKSGALVRVGALVGVASTDAAEDEPVEVAIEGVFELDGGSFSQGAIVYADATTLALTGTATANPVVGVAIADSANSKTLVKLVTHAGPLAA